jgi:uncharacterized protein (TIGR02001 family)
MKKMKVFAVAMVALMAASSAKAQEFKASADVVSSYVWRGTFQSGVAVQPTFDFTTGGFSIGAWGSTALSELSGSLMQEADLYAKYTFGFGLSAGLTDYYYSGNPYFAGASHVLEANLGYSLGNLSLSGNYLLNANNDLYFEAGYAFDKVSVFVGAGNEVYSTDGKFALLNIGASTTKEIKITDTFSIPLKASVILNPKSEQFFFVAGITL